MRILVIVPGIVVIGALTFIYMSLHTPDASFFLGFIVCLVCVSLLYILVLIRRRFSARTDASGISTVVAHAGKPIRSFPNEWLLPSFIIIVGGLTAGFLIYKQHELSKARVQQQRTQFAQQSALIESTRRNGLMFIMGNLLNEMDEDLRSNPDRKLRDETIARTAALSHALKPYTLIEGDSLSPRKLSPERAQLLMALAKMQIDSTSLHKILRQATFANANLREVDLRSADLQGADLREADLREADLHGANLREADLRSAELWGADLTMTEMYRADLKRAVLRWADLTGAKMKEADLSGTDLTAAQVRKADLRGALIQWANLSNSVFNESDMTAANLFGSKLENAILHKVNFGEAHLRMANLSEANLSEANLQKANLSEANLNGADLSGAELGGAIVFEDEWLEKLGEWNVTGSGELRDQYIVMDSLSNGSTRYWLEKRSD